MRLMQQRNIRNALTAISLRLKARQKGRFLRTKILLRSRHSLQDLILKSGFFPKSTKKTSRNLKIKRLNASYNYYLHYAPQGFDLHFHIEVSPRFAKWGGFELSTGAIINSVMPEDAARFYRSK